MRKQEAEKILESWLNPVLGFALKRCKTPEDAEDLSQEIILRVYRALLLRDDVEDVSKFIWTVAHNALCNYYRSASKNMIGILVEALADLPAESAEDAEEDAETVERLKKEIAYLSGLQRKIVIAYYIDHKKQEQIARELGIPVGTVKWHLFEAKKELKKGMGKMREASSLKYNPVRFVTRGITGSLGRKDVYDMFGSPLVQNLCYAVRDTWKTVNEIADDLGVSPVYLEDEAARLEEFGFLKKKGDKYLADFLLEEPSLDFLRLENDTYKAAADLFADELYTRLTERGVLDSPAITGRWKTDKNFLLWALIPYIAACSGDSVREMKISFEEAATVRKDGGTNIFHAQVREAVPEEYEAMNGWFGPCWNGDGKHILWQVGSEWSDNLQERAMNYQEDAAKILALYEREQQEKLSVDEYAWLAQMGQIVLDSEDRAQWQIVVLDNQQIREELLAIGTKIREEKAAEFRELKETYTRAALKNLPSQMRKMKEFELQFLFNSDGRFVYYCLKKLVNSGKLTPPPEEQKKAMSTLIMPA